MASPAIAQFADRYQAMDDNNDGVISRSEWRGSDQSFRRHDWNNDGVADTQVVMDSGATQTLLGVDVSDIKGSMLFGG